MGRDEEVDEIELQQPQAVDHRANMAGVHTPARARPIQALGCQGEPACLVQ